MPQRKTMLSFIALLAVGPLAALAGMAVACRTAGAETIHTPIGFDWNGLPLGRATLNYEETDATYSAAVDGVANGLGNVFVRLATQTESKGSLQGGALSPRSYDSAYQLKNKNKQIHLRWDGAGVLVQDQILPETDRAKRPAVGAAKKKGAVDPLTAFWQLRAWLAPGEALARGAASATVKLWDGKRLYDLQVTNMRNAEWQEYRSPEAGGVLRMQATRLRVRRIGIAGFTPDEQAGLEANRNTEFSLYYCAEETARCHDREPLGMEMPAILGMLRVSRVTAAAAPVAPVTSGPVTDTPAEGAPESPSR